MIKAHHWFSVFVNHRITTAVGLEGNVVHRIRDYLIILELVPIAIYRQVDIGVSQLFIVPHLKVVLVYGIAWSDAKELTVAVVVVRLGIP